MISVIIFIGCIGFSMGQDVQAECPFNGSLSLVADYGGTTANMSRISIPGLDDVDVRFFPDVVEEGTRNVYYWYPNITTICPLEVTVTVYRCNSSEISTTLIKDSKCEDLEIGKSCIAYCPEGYISDASPPEFTCALRDDNTTYWTQHQSSYSCLENVTGLICPPRMIFYTSPSINFTSIRVWNLDVSNTTLSGFWNVTYESFVPGYYHVGEHTNIVGAINSHGETSSCNVTMEVIRKTCTVPTFEDGATIEGALANETFYMFSSEKKICEEGYAFPEDFEDDHVRILCLEDANDNLYWRYWNQRKCSRKYMPYSCERRVKIEKEENNAGMYEFVYSFNEWEQVENQNKSECFYHAKQSSTQNRMYNLEMTFETNVTDVHYLKENCFFQVLLYSGRQEYNTPMKILDCTVSQSINMNWPSSEFFLVIKLFDNFTEYRNTDMNWHGFIKYNFSECHDCEFESITGNSENDTQYFEYIPVAPCRMSGCMEDALHGYKVSIYAADRDSMFSIYRKNCRTDFQIQNGVQRICLHQTQSRYNNKYCRTLSTSTPVKLKFGHAFEMEVFCDDLQGWWCIPFSTDFNYLNVSWTSSFRYGNDSQEIWLVSVSDNRGLQTCANPVVFTTPKPVVITTTPYTFSLIDTTKWTIIGTCLSVSGTCLSACAGIICYKKRKGGNWNDSAAPAVQLNTVGEKA